MVRHRFAKPLFTSSSLVDASRVTCLFRSLLHCCRDGEIGRRKGLKIPRTFMSVPVRPRLSVLGDFLKGSPLFLNPYTSSKTHIIKPLNCYILCHIVSRLVCVFFRLSFYQFLHYWLQSNCYVKKPNS